METLLHWDSQILLWIQETLRADWLTPIMQAVTFLGEAGWFWIALAAVLCCFRPTRRAASTRRAEVTPMPGTRRRAS